jgi:hypothetical protein
MAGALLLLVTSQEIYPTGIPVVTAQVKGNFVEDTRSEVSGVNITFNENTPSDDTIVRASGSFSTDGYVAGDRVAVTGSASNNGIYTVQTVAALTLTLATTDDLADEGPVGGVTLKRWAHPDNGGDNPALCIRDYLLSDVYGAAIPEAEIDDTSFEAMANFYDEAVDQYAGGPTQERFTCSGWLDTARPVADNLQLLLATCRGNLVFQGGMYRLFTTRSVTASGVKLTRDNIIGAWAFREAGRQGKYNTVSVHYADADWGKGEPRIRDWPAAGAANTYLTEDNSLATRLEIELPMVDNVYRGEQIGMVLVKESRQSIACEMTCNEEALQLEVGDVVEVTHDTPGWDDKKFWVVGLGLMQNTNVRVALQEYDASAYTYDAQTVDDTEPNTNLPDPFTVAAPTSLVLTSDNTTAIITEDGTYLPRIHATWTAAADPFVREYQIQAKLTADSEWNAVGETTPDDLEFYIGPVTDNVSWSVRVRTINRLGVSSAWLSDTVTPAVGAPKVLSASLSFDQTNTLKVTVRTVNAGSVRLADSSSAYPGRPISPWMATGTPRTRGRRMRT